MLDNNPNQIGNHDEAPLDQLRPRGSNQNGVRQYNERVVLQAIRLHGSMPKADLARLTKLSSQTIALIMARLESDDLVVKLDPLRGKIGQPSVPMALNPDGAFSIGVKIGRRSLDILLVDFVGTVRSRSSTPYAFPDPSVIFPVIQREVQVLRKSLAPDLRSRIAGIGVAAPFSLGSWQHLQKDVPVDAWRWDQVDIAQQIEQDTGFSVEFAKDTAAACVAELIFGRGRSVKNFLYVFVDTFIGGGLVINSHLHTGLHGNAGAVGSQAMNMVDTESPKPSPQLLSVASLLNLEKMYEQAQLEQNAAYDERALMQPWVAHTETWLRQAGNAIAMLVVNSTCLLDLEGIIVDGSFNRDLLDRLMLNIELAINHYNWEGVDRPVVLTGTIGSDARALGGALMPLYANFSPDRNLFLKVEN